MAPSQFNDRAETATPNRDKHWRSRRNRDFVLGRTIHKQDLVETVTRVGTNTGVPAEIVTLC